MAVMELPRGASETGGSEARWHSVQLGENEASLNSTWESNFQVQMQRFLDLCGMSLQLDMEFLAGVTEEKMVFA